MQNTFRAIVSPAWIDTVRSAAQEIDEKAWFLGDKTLELYKKIQNLKSEIITTPGKYAEKIENSILGIGFPTVMLFMADIANMAQVTIKRYSDLARYYQPKTRAKYELLPMSHFEWAMGYPDYSEDILEVDLKLADAYGGKPVPLRMMQKLFRSVDQIPEMLDQIDTLDKMEEVLALSNYEQPKESPEVKDQIPPLVYHFLNNYPRIAEYLINAVDRWAIPSHMKKEIVKAVNTLYDLIGDSKEIMDDIDREVKIR